MRWLLVFLIFGACTTTQPQTSWGGVGLTHQEAEYLVNESLRLVIERQCIVGDLNFLQNRRLIPVLADSVESLTIRPAGEVSFELVSTETLAARAEEHGSYVYFFRFAPPTRHGARVLLELVNIPHYAANPRTQAFGSGVTIEFEKQGGSWTHACGGGWIE